MWNNCIVFHSHRGVWRWGEEMLKGEWRWMKVPQTHRSHLSSVARKTSHWPAKVSVRQTPGGCFYTLGQGFPISRLHTSTFCQISDSIRLKIKSTIHILHLNHSQTFLPPPVHGKTISHEISPWCQKGCGPLVYMTSPAPKQINSCPFSSHCPRTGPILAVTFWSCGFDVRDTGCIAEWPWALILLLLFCHLFVKIFSQPV